MKGGFLFLLLSVLPWSAYNQVVQGRVLAAKDSAALEGVSVYYESTSLGTSTDKEGFFVLEKTQTESPVVISYLGFETKLFDSGLNDSIIYLRESPEKLPEVLLTPDPWSREKKLQIFLREFIGNSAAAEKVKLKNKEVLDLRYDPVRNRLRASADEPLIITNRYLGYRVHYNLVSFEVKFRMSESGLRLVESVSYSGLSFFQPLKDEISKRIARNRESAYYGSSLHFLRSLSVGLLAENEFKVFHEQFQVPAYEIYDLEQKDHGVSVQMEVDQVTLLYKDIEQSTMNALEVFSIDPLGNHSPPLALVFGGQMAIPRLAQQLPLDYFP